MRSRLEYKVPFSETDAMGIVHHSNYARYFERGRIELLREIGKPYTEFMKRGFHFPVLTMTASFKKPAKFDDKIVIETRVGAVSKTRLRFDYTIYADDGAILTEGATEHCCVNDQLRPAPIPKEEQEILMNILEIK